MSRFISLALLTLALLAASCKNHIESKARVDPGWKKIPDRWIRNAIGFNYGKPDTSLISAFAQLIKPDTLDNPHAEHVDPDYGPVFNAILVDLDGDQNNELVCLQGWDVTEPYLCVFEQKGGNWYLIYKEEVSTFYSSPTLVVANNYSKNKTFYLDRVYDHGSGVYIGGYSFYKLVDDHVYKCLDIINDAHLYGWSPTLNQAVTSSFEFSDYSDEVSVSYNYSFFPGMMEKSDCPLCASDSIPYIKGEGGVIYSYNQKEHKYTLNIPAYANGAEDLTDDKISCFADMGNDSLFIAAFRRQIDTTLKIGALKQRLILRQYLSLVDRNRTANHKK